MARLLTVLLVLTVVACAVASPGVITPPLKGTAQATKGSISVGNVAGGEFGDGVFSIGHGGSSSGLGDGGHGGNQASKS